MTNTDKKNFNATIGNTVLCPLLTWEHLSIYLPYGLEVMGEKRLKNGKTRNKDNAFGVNGANYMTNDLYYPQSIIQISNAQRTGRIHPTEKPTDLMRYLILTYSNKGETVFDGYSGSGTTAEACMIEQRNFIGSELNKEYFDKSVQRLKNVPQSLF